MYLRYFSIVRDFYLLINYIQPVQRVTVGEISSQKNTNNDT